MRIEKRKISELIKAEYNPRKISVVQLQELKDGIEEYGLVSPLVVNEYPERKNVIVGGHQRLKLWEELGNKEVHCSIVNLPLDKERKLNIKLNKNGGTFDDDLLKEFFDYEELIEWGFTASELFDMDEIEIKGNIEDDEIPEVKESKVKRGDIWQLGEHRVMCGDSTSSDDVAKLMNGEKADMVFTDPPYGIAHSGKGITANGVKGNDFGEILGDKDINVAQDSFSLINNIYSDCLQVWWGANYYCQSIPNGYGWLFWDKETQGNTFSGGEIAFVNKGKRFDVFRHRWAGFCKASEMGEKRLHATQKPIALAEWCFKNYEAGNLILDIFLGSGSTLIAAEKLNRKCYGMELDEKYCDVIIERWEQFTGNKAEKIN